MALSTRRRSRAHSNWPLGPRGKSSEGNDSCIEPGSSGLPMALIGVASGAEGSTRSWRTPEGVRVVSSRVSFLICSARALASLMRVVVTGWVRRKSGVL